jgi:hypothetical protein
VIDRAAGAEHGTSNIINYVRRLLISLGIGSVSAGADQNAEAKADRDIGADDDIGSDGVGSDDDIGKGDIRSTDNVGRQPDQPAIGAEGLMAGFQQWSGPAPAGPVPRVALVGEFSAGKSSIINLLLERDMLPTAVLASTRRPSLLRHAPSPQIEAIFDDGKRELVTPDSVDMLSRADINHFDIGLPNELLRFIELIDTPGFADPDREPRRTLDMIRRADICLWCTLATQAWRHSERQTWLNLKAQFGSNGILVATHVDTLANRSERKRIRTRLEREAGDLFSEIVLLAVPDAKRARKADGRVADPMLWRDSGGEALLGALQRAAVKHRENSKPTASPDAVEQSPPAPDDIAPPPSATGAAAADAPQAVEITASETSADDGEGAAATPQKFLAQTFLAKVMNTVPGCLVAAWVDLSDRRVLELRGLEADDDAGFQSLGNAIAELFQGTKVRAIEAAFKRSRGAAEDDKHYFREILIIADGCVGMLLRDRSRADRGLVVVSDGAVNLGMVLATTRGLMASTAGLIDRGA